MAAWMLQALASRFRVSLLGWRPVDLAAVDSRHGTRLAGAGLHLAAPPAALRACVGLVPLHLTQARWSFLLRASRRLRPGALRVSASNECDFGVPGIQYVHYPWTYQLPARAHLRSYQRWPGLAAGYRAASLRLADFSFERMKRNLTLVNSSWTAERFRQRHGTRATVLHPPAAGVFADVPWQRRSDDFVCAGRLSHEKRYEEIVDIVERLRGRGHRGGLHIVAIEDDATYAGRIRRLAADRPWVELHEDVPRSALVEVLGRCRYALHAMRDEHFGIAVAEAMRAGCIPFVHRSGGVLEALGPDVPELAYGDEDEAVARIERVAGDTGLQASLRAALASRAGLFSEEAFMRAFLAHVDAFVEARVTRAG